MSVTLAYQSAVFENPDLLREIGMFIEPRLPMFFVFHSAREALLLLEQENSDGVTRIKSVKRNFVSSVPLLKWVMSQGCSFYKKGRFPLPYLIDYAAAGGFIDVIEWASSQTPPFPCDASAFSKAAANGRLDVLKYLYSKFPNVEWWQDDEVPYCCAAAKGGHINILEWLTYTIDGFETCFECVDNAASTGQLETIKWLLTLDYDVDDDDVHPSTISSAAAGGHLHIIQYLREEIFPPCEWDSLACSNAADHGHLHVLKYLRSQDPPCPMVQSSCRNAAARIGSIEILEFLKNDDLSLAPWDASVVTNAVENNHFHVLKWLRDLSPPCDWDPVLVIREAIIWDRLDIIKFVLSTSSPVLDESISEICGQYNDIEILQFLRNLDPPCPWDSTLLKTAISLNNFDIIKFALSQDPKCPWDSSVCAACVISGNLDILKWLRALKPPCPWNKKECISLAKDYDFVDILAWLKPRKKRKKNVY